MLGQPESKSTPDVPAAAGRPSCPGCSVAQCPGDGQPQDCPLAGWRLGLVSIGLFLGPIVLAILGALWAGPNPGAQFVGAVVGFGLGLAGSVATAKMVTILHRGREKTA